MVKFDALVVDPRPEWRMRLKQATGMLPYFGEVRLCDKTIKALSALSAERNWQIVFLSHRLGEQGIREFCKEAAELTANQPCTFVLLLDPETQNSQGLVSGLEKGMDAFLFEPYSVEGLREVIEVAQRVHKEKAAVQEKGALLFLIRDCIKNIDAICEHLATDRHPGLYLKRLQEAAKILEGLDQESMTRYFDLMLAEFTAIEPPAAPHFNHAVQYRGCSKRVKERLRQLAFKKAEREQKEETVDKAAAERKENISSSFRILKKR